MRDFLFYYSPPQRESLRYSKYIRNALRDYERSLCPTSKWTIRSTSHNIATKSPNSQFLFRLTSSPCILLIEPSDLSLFFPYERPRVHDFAHLNHPIRIIQFNRPNPKTGPHLPTQQLGPHLPTEKNRNFRLNGPVLSSSSDGEPPAPHVPQGLTGRSGA